MRRIDCHRRVAGLYRSVTDAEVVDAAEKHASWMDVNGLAWTEKEGTVGYTGNSVWDRLVVAGYDDETARDHGIWDVIGLGGPRFSAVALVDELLIHSSVNREIALQLSWAAGGFGDGLDTWELIVVYDLPATERVFEPVVYPADGQADVPVSSYALEPAGYYDPTWLPWGELLGYPITITFGAGELGPETLDLYEITVNSAKLTGPDGEVELQSAAPGSTKLRTYYSAVVLPLEPLLPDSEYHFKAEVSSIEGDDVIESTFTTRADESPANPRLKEFYDEQAAGGAEARRVERSRASPAAGRSSTTVP